MNTELQAVLEGMTTPGDLGGLNDISQPLQPDAGTSALGELATLGASDPAYGYYKLDVVQTKAEFTTLDDELDLACQAVAQAHVKLEAASPYLSRMQALLSQRGDERHKVLKKAGLPTWTVWVKGYAEKVNSSTRSIQRHIKDLREDGGCIGCGNKKGVCTCPKLCTKCKKQKTACICPKKVAIQEPYLRALQRLVLVAHRAADRHEDKDLANAVKYATCGNSRSELVKLGVQPTPKAWTEDSDSHLQEDCVLSPEELNDIFLTNWVRREFLTAVTNETELLVILGEMARLFYESNQTPESERSVRVEKHSASGRPVDGEAKPKGEVWSPERKKAHAELIKAGLARKKAFQAA